MNDRASGTEVYSVEQAVVEVRAASSELTGPTDLEPFVDRLADKRVVMIGGASHGTSEFYRWRARLTADLVREADVSFVAVEGDWPDCYDVNRYVEEMPESAGSGREVLETFERLPTWLWANWEVPTFVERLAEHNADRDERERVGFYGLDVYSLRESMAAVVDYPADVDPDAADQNTLVAKNAEEYYRAMVDELAAGDFSDLNNGAFPNRYDDYMRDWLACLDDLEALDAVQQFPATADD